MKSDNDASTAVRRTRPWYVTGGFVTAVVGLTIASGVGAADGWASGLNVAAQRVSDAHGSTEKPDDSNGPARNKDELACDANGLIAAIQLANRHGGATLELAKDCTYLLTANQDGSGLPVITERVTLRGDNTTIERAANAADFRIFTVAAGGELELAGLTVKGGRTSTTNLDGGGAVLVQAGGGLEVFGSKFIDNRSTLDGGGAIDNRGVTEIKQSVFTNNSAPRGGGAIANEGGQLSVEDSELKHNSARIGGAVYGGGAITLANVDLEDNTAVDAGGGVYVTGYATIRESSISGNSASLGGGVFVALRASAVIRDTEIITNTSVLDGGGLYNEGNLVIEDSKVNHNQVDGLGGGIYNGGLFFGPVGVLTLRNSEVNANTAFGEPGQGGGIFNFLGRVTLVDSEVTRNASTRSPGGVYSTNADVILTGDSVIIANRPTNCGGGQSVVIVGCFG